MSKVKRSSRQNTAAVAHQGATVTLGNASPKKDAGPGQGGPKRQQRARSAAPFEVRVRRRVHGQIVLRNAMLAVDLLGASSRFRVNTAQVTVLSSGRRPINWRFAGARGSITLELPRKEAWDLLDCVQEQSIAPGPARLKEKGTAN